MYLSIFSSTHLSIPPFISRKTLLILALGRILEIDVEGSVFKEAPQASTVSSDLNVLSH